MLCTLLAMSSASTPGSRRTNAFLSPVGLGAGQQQHASVPGTRSKDGSVVETKNEMDATEGEVAELRGKYYRTRVFTLMAGMPYSALTAALIWCLLARTSQMNTSVCKRVRSRGIPQKNVNRGVASTGVGEITLKSSIFFITTSDVRGYLQTLSKTLAAVHGAHLKMCTQITQIKIATTGDSRSLNNGVVVQPSILGGHSTALVFGSAGGLEGGWAVEVHRGANLGLGPDNSLLNVSCGGLGFGGGSLNGCCFDIGKEHASTMA